MIYTFYLSNVNSICDQSVKSDMALIQINESEKEIVINFTSASDRIYEQRKYKSQEFIDILTKGVIPCQTYSVNEDKKYFTADKARDQYYSTMNEKEKNTLDFILKDIQENCTDKAMFEYELVTYKVYNKLIELGFDVRMNNHSQKVHVSLLK